MTTPRSLRDDPTNLRRLTPDASEPSLRGPGSPRPQGTPRPGLPRAEPPRRRPDPTSLRLLVTFAGIASASALAAAMLPSVVPVTDAAGSVATTGQVLDAAVAAPSVRHVTRYVTLKPGQTAPPHASVITRPTPTPRVTVVTRTRQSGKP